MGLDGTAGHDFEGIQPIGNAGFAVFVAEGKQTDGGEDVSSAAVFVLLCYVDQLVVFSLGRLNDQEGKLVPAPDFAEDGFAGVGLTAAGDTHHQKVTA